MDTLLASPVFQMYTVSCVILLATLYALAFHTALTRGARRVVVNPEDVALDGRVSVAEVDHPDVQRIKRAHLNLLENAVPFFVVGFLYTLTGPGVAMAAGLFGVFVVIRVLHAAFYLTATQPFRTASFAIGALVNLIMVALVGWKVVGDLG